MKKYFKIIIGVIFIIVCLFLSIYYFYQQKIKSENIKIQTDDYKKINTIIDNRKKRIATESSVSNIEVENIKNDKVLGSKDYILNDNFDIKENLYSRNTNLNYYDDEKLSTTFDSIYNYYKIWILYDKKNNISYDVINTYNDFCLFLNVKINDNYLDFDYMGKPNIINHCKIDVDEFINKILIGNKLDFYNYFIDNNVIDFSKSNKIDEINAKLNNNDLNIQIFEDEKHVNSGYMLNINNISQNIFIDYPNTKIGIINFKNNLQGLLLTNKNSGINDFYYVIYIFKDTKFIKFFECNEEIINLNLIDKISYFNFEDNVQLIMSTKDLVQNWTIEKNYEIYNNNLKIKQENYFKANDIINSISLQDIYIYKDKNVNSEKFLLKQGSEVKFIGTDLNNWVVISYNNDIYYILIDEFGNIKDLNIPPILIFPDLIYGD